MKQVKALKYKPMAYTDAEMGQAIRELKGHRSFMLFCEALHNLREASLARMWHDDVISDERVSLCYQVEARVYSDIINRIADAGEHRLQVVDDEQT